MTCGDYIFIKRLEPDMSWGINPNATEKEKIFAKYND